MLGLLDEIAVCIGALHATRDHQPHLSVAFYTFVNAPPHSTPLETTNLNVQSILKTSHPSVVDNPARLRRDAGRLARGLPPHATPIETTKLGHWKCWPMRQVPNLASRLPLIPSNPWAALVLHMHRRGSLRRSCMGIQIRSPARKTLVGVCGHLWADGDTALADPRLRDAGGLNARGRLFRERRVRDRVRSRELTPKKYASYDTRGRLETPGLGLRYGVIG
ncbi:hypothetical protein EV715DRAFT_268543, partial [Schizophyllum commune]